MRRQSRAISQRAQTITTLLNAGVKVTDDGGKLKFTGTANQSIEVQVAGDTHNTLGLGSWSTQSNSVVTGGAAVSAGANAGLRLPRGRTDPG